MWKGVALPPSSPPPSLPPFLNLRQEKKPWHRILFRSQQSYLNNQNEILFNKVSRIRIGPPQFLLNVAAVEGSSRMS